MASHDNIDDISCEDYNCDGGLSSFAFSQNRQKNKWASQQIDKKNKNKHRNYNRLSSLSLQSRVRSQHGKQRRGKQSHILHCIDIDDGESDGDDAMYEMQSSITGSRISVKKPLRAALDNGLRRLVLRRRRRREANARLPSQLGNKKRKRKRNAGGARQTRKKRKATTGSRAGHAVEASHGSGGTYSSSYGGQPLLKSSAKAYPQPQPPSKPKSASKWRLTWQPTPARQPTPYATPCQCEACQAPPSSWSSPPSSSASPYRDGKYAFAWPFAVSRTSEAKSSVTASERGQATHSQVRLTFGELTEYGVTKALLDLDAHKRLRANSVADDASCNLVFYDLGTASGKVPLQVFLQFGQFAKCVGIEFNQSRFALAVRNMESLVEHGYQGRKFEIAGKYSRNKEKRMRIQERLSGARVRTCEVWQGNLFDYPNGIKDSDICNLAVDFPSAMNGKLIRLMESTNVGSTFLTYHDIDLWSCFNQRGTMLASLARDKYDVSWSSYGSRFYAWQRVGEGARQFTSVASHSSDRDCVPVCPTRVSKEKERKEKDAELERAAQEVRRQKQGDAQPHQRQAAYAVRGGNVYMHIIGPRRRQPTSCGSSWSRGDKKLFGKDKKKCGLRYCLTKNGNKNKWASQQIHKKNKNKHRNCKTTNQMKSKHCKQRREKQIHILNCIDINDDDMDDSYSSFAMEGSITGSIRIKKQLCQQMDNGFKGKRIKKRKQKKNEKHKRMTYWQANVKTDNMKQSADCAGRCVSDTQATQVTQALSASVSVSCA